MEKNFLIKNGLITFRLFWIVTVQDWTETSLAVAIHPLRTLNVSNVIELDNLLIKRSKISAAFSIII